MESLDRRKSLRTPTLPKAPEGMRIVYFDRDGKAYLAFIDQITAAGAPIAKIWDSKNPIVGMQDPPEAIQYMSAQLIRSAAAKVIVGRFDNILHAVGQQDGEWCLWRCDGDPEVLADWQLMGKFAL